MTRKLHPLFGSLVLAALLVAAPPGNARAELTGHVDLEHLGIAFTVPDQWQGQLMDAGVVLGGLREPGLILLLPHEHATLDDLRREASAGIAEEGVSLRPAAALEAIGDDALGGRFTGSVSGHPAEVYVVARLNPHGEGVIVMAMTDAENYSARYEALAREIAASLAFREVERSPLVDEITDLLRHTRLTYLESYSSGSGGGYSTRRSIDLCPDMRFHQQGSTQLGVDVGGAFGSAQGRGQGAGRWLVIADQGHRARLELRHDSGAVQQYVVHFEEGRTYLDGERYFRIGANDPNGNGPRCR